MQADYVDSGSLFDSKSWWDSFIYVSHKIAMEWRNELFLSCLLALAKGAIKLQGRKEGVLARFAIVGSEPADVQVCAIHHHCGQRDRMKILCWLEWHRERRDSSKRARACTRFRIPVTATASRCTLSALRTSASLEKSTAWSHLSARFAYLLFGRKLKKIAFTISTNRLKNFRLFLFLKYHFLQLGLGILWCPFYL